jgi:hypothetical protein
MSIAEKNRKREQAAERQAQYDALSTSQKIERALSRRGNSTREVSRLTASLED